MKTKTYVATVVNITDRQAGIEVAFVYDGSTTGNIHFDLIPPSSGRYEKAKKLKIGDEVHAAPIELDRIFHFKFNHPFKRFFIRTFKMFWFNF